MSFCDVKKGGLGGIYRTWLPFANVIFKALQTQYFVFETSNQFVVGEIYNISGSTSLTSSTGN